MQWLRNKNIVTVKNFHSDCEWKWLINNNSERLHTKENESVHKAHAKISEIIGKVFMNIIKNATKLI